MLHSLASHLATALLLSPSLPVADIFVDVGSANCASGTGTLVDPVCSITAAIAIAAPGDTVRIAPGTYFESVVLGIDLELLGTDGAEVTIVESASGLDAIEVQSAVTATIGGLTLTGPAQFGSGGLNVDSSASVTLQNSTIVGASSRGIKIGSATLNVQDCEIRDSGVKGIAAYESVVSVSNTTISNNGPSLFPWVAGNGGGIYTRNGVLVVTDSTISGNRSGFGAGVLCYRTDFVVSNTTISGNSAFNVGGLMSRFCPTTSLLENVTITQNESLYSAQFGAACYPGGLHSNSTLGIRNTIVVRNFLDGAPFDIGGDVTLLTNNLIGRSSTYTYYSCPGTGGFSGYGDGQAGNHVGSNPNPGLGPLQMNGSSTATHALIAGSLAIDGGDPFNFQPFDQRGKPRPIGAAPDIGAFELDTNDTLAGSSLCSGNGGNQMGCTNCPCTNNAPAGTVGGCLNSAASSGRLVASGDFSISLPSMSADDLRFSLLGLPPFKFSILISGDAVAPTNPGNPCFTLDSGTPATAFDGLRCAVVNIRRHGGRAADDNGAVGVTNNPWGGEGGPPIGIAQTHGGFSAGQTRFFQSIYRDAANRVCMRGLNTSQAVEITFTP